MAMLPRLTNDGQFPSKEMNRITNLAIEYGKKVREKLNEQTKEGTQTTEEEKSNIECAYIDEIIKIFHAQTAVVMPAALIDYVESIDALFHEFAHLALLFGMIWEREYMQDALEDLMRNDSSNDDDIPLRERI